MLSVLLIILKIIGIVLLSVIGILLCFLLLVLFVPVRYRVNGYYKDKFVCHGKISWFLHFISFSFDVEDGVVTSLRILGIPASVFIRKVKQKEDSASKVKNNEITSADTKSFPQEDTPSSVEEHQNLSDDMTPKLETLEAVSSSESVLKKIKSFINGLYQKVNVFVSKLKEIYYKIRQIPLKIKNVLLKAENKKELAKRYISILQSETTKQAFFCCKNRILCAIKHILPRRMKVVVDYGFADPSSTGYILAVYGMLPSWVGKKIILHPDFNRDFLECDFSVRGIIRMWTLLYQVIRILLDSNCRSFYHIVKKEIKNERK